MRTRFRIVIISLVALVFLIATNLQSVSAQSVPTEEQLDKITVNCLSIKSNLNQLHASDALLRVNRGQLYESISTKLMSAFNNRLTSNSFDAKGLAVVLTGYRTALEAFQGDYRSYERQLSAAIKVDCNKEPLEFHNAIEDARTKRNKVHDDVAKLNQYIDDYRSAVNDFYVNYQRVTETN